PKVVQGRAPAVQDFRALPPHLPEETQSNQLLAELRPVAAAFPCSHAAVLDSCGQRYIGSPPCAVLTLHVPCTRGKNPLAPPTPHARERHRRNWRLQATNQCKNSGYGDQL